MAALGTLVGATLLVVSTLVLIAADPWPAVAPPTAVPTPTADADAEHASLSVVLPREVLRDYGYAPDDP